jgi:hypothetical protein
MRARRRRSGERDSGVLRRRGAEALFRDNHWEIRNAAVAKTVTNKFSPALNVPASLRIDARARSVAVCSFANIPVTTKSIKQAA